MKYYFIINPHSQSGYGIRIWKEQLRPLLNRHNIPCRALYTRQAGHCTRLVQKLTQNARTPRTIIILGGDGTMNEAVNGYSNPRLCTLAFIPIGSSNDLARGLGLQGTPVQMLQNILNKTHELCLDCGVVKSPDKDPRRFIVSSGIGFDASVTNEALNSSIKKVLNKIHLGKLTYTLIALKQLYRIHLKKAALILDEDRVLHVNRFYFASSQNFPFEGGGFKFTPTADAADGQLNLCLVHSLWKPVVMCLLPTAYFGKHLLFKGVETYSFRHMKLMLEESFPIHTDGETYCFHNQADVYCEPRAIHFVY